MRCTECFTWTIKVQNHGRILLDHKKYGAFMVINLRIDVISKFMMGTLPADAGIGSIGEGVGHTS